MGLPKVENFFMQAGLPIGERLQEPLLGTLFFLP
jgi:hypothetical protein